MRWLGGLTVAATTLGVWASAAEAAPTTAVGLSARGDRLEARVATTVRCAGRAFRVVGRRVLTRSGTRVRARKTSVRRLSRDRRLVAAWRLAGRIDGGRARGRLSVRARLVTGDRRRPCARVAGRAWTATVPVTAPAPAPAPASGRSALEALLAGLPAAPVELGLAVDGSRLTTTARWRLDLTGDPGDYVVPGGSRALSSAGSDPAGTSAAAGRVGFGTNPTGPGTPPGWTVLIDHPPEQPLTTGSWSTSQLTQPRTAPTLAVNGEGRSCGATRTTFSIDVIERLPDQRVSALLVRFEQRCEENLGSALRGTLAFQAA